jgi:two-component sensor histidine kinase
LRPGWRNISSSVHIRPGSAEAYGVALIFVGAASLARWGLGIIDYESAPYTTYYPAVLLATVVGGTGTGAFAATVGGAIGWWAFAPPHFALLPMRFGQELRLVIYLFVAFLFVFGIDHYRKLAKRRQDVAKRLEDEDRLRKLAVEELGHRLKNKLAMIQSIVCYQLRELPDLRNEITNRLVALSRTDDLIMTMKGEGARIGDIFSSELGPHGLSRTSVHGPDLSLPPRLAWMMALLVHELATNAAKYGALSTPEGKLTIRWSLKVRTLKLEWRESGGPPVAPPTRFGFGLRLLSHGLDQFDGSVATTFEKSGLICTMTATMPEVAPTNVIPDGSHSHAAAA